MTRRTLSPTETIAQLKRRRTAASKPANIRIAAKVPDTVWRHKFQVGQTVTLAPTHYGANRQGGFEVTSLLPREHGVNQYRLRSRMDGHDRVANEDELS